MVTLKEAFRLCMVDDRQVIHPCDSVEQAQMWSWPMTGKEVREKYDMKHTMVTAIFPHFCIGKFEGFTFVITKKGTGHGQS